jgi:hypothetical protein
MDRQQQQAHDERVEQAHLEAAIELEEAELALEEAHAALHAALTLEANGDRVLRDAYDERIREASEEVLACIADRGRAERRFDRAERALRLGAEVDA